jgi:hypothetical protein
MIIRQVGPIRLETLEGFNLQISDICSSKAIIDLPTGGGFLRNSLRLFLFRYESADGNFELEAKVRDGAVFIVRNGSYQHSEQYYGDGDCLVSLQWAEDSIACGIVPPDTDPDVSTHLRATRTQFTHPPAETLQILRTAGMLPGPPHATKRDLVGAVIDSLVCCEADIRRQCPARS